MIKFFLALTACLFLGPSLAAQTTVNSDTTYESYIANYDVNSDGTYTNTTEVLLRISSKAAIERINPWRISYNSDLHSSEILEAYTLKPTGRRILVPATSIQTQLSPEAQAAPEFTSFKIQFVAFPDLKPGDAVFVKTRVVGKKTYFDGHFDLVEVFSVNSLWNAVQVNVSAPQNYPLYWDNVDMEGGRLPDRDGRARWQWKTRVTQTIPLEFGATNIGDYSPRLVVSSFPDFETLGAAYWAEAGKKVTVTPAIQQLADEITKDINEPHKQVRAVYEWVNKNIRYVAIMIGRGVFVPHDVSAILQSRYGDCKDYVTILQSLLAAKGIESMPVLIRADDSFWFPKIPTLIFFNHVILYLPSLDVYVDATNPSTAFGLLPQTEMGKSAVLAGRKTGKVSIPEGKPDGNQMQSEVNLSVLTDGGMKATASTVIKGRLEMIFRPLFADRDPESLSGTIPKVLEAYGLKGYGKFIEISNPHGTGEGLSIKTEYQLLDVMKVTGPGQVAVPQGLDLISYAGLSMFVEAEERKTSVLAGASRIFQKFQLAFPQGLNVTSVPPGITVENATGHFHSNYKNEGGIVTVTREIVINRDIITPKEYSAFRELITKGIEDSKAQIQYSPANGYQPSTKVASKNIESQSQGYIDSYSFFESLGLAVEAQMLSQKKVFALESLLMKNPHDVRTRILLINYYIRVGPTHAVGQALVRHRKWLIEKHPEKDFLLDSNPFTSTSQPGPVYQELKNAWLQQLELKKDNKKVILNAASFFARQDPQIAETLLERGQQLEPDDYRWAVELGELHARHAKEKNGDEKTKAFALSIEQFEKALALNKKERSYRRDTDRISLLRKLSDVAFDAQQLEKAKRYATELLLEFGRDESRYSQADIAHDENILLGRIALREGDLEKAKEYLLIAGRSAVLAVKAGERYLIPKMTLAKELFEKNEKQIVIEYLDLFDGYSLEKSKALKKWATMIRKGETPSFDYYAK